jgi:hypothetical protein
LTLLAALPAGAAHSLVDPFAVKKRRWPLVLGIVLVAAAALAALWFLGIVDAWLPTAFRRAP